MGTGSCQWHEGRGDRGIGWAQGDGTGITMGIKGSGGSGLWGGHNKGHWELGRGHHSPQPLHRARSAGPGRWRDQLSPSRALEHFARTQGLPAPEFSADGTAVTFGCSTFLLSHFGGSGSRGCRGGIMGPLRWCEGSALQRAAPPRTGTPGRPGSAWPCTCSAPVASSPSTSRRGRSTTAPSPGWSRWGHQDGGDRGLAGTLG